MAAALPAVSNWTPPTPKESWLGGTGRQATFKNPLLVAAMMEEIRRKDEEAQKAADDGYYSYGDISSIDDILGLNQAPAEPQNNSLQSALMAEDKTLPAYRKGGAVMKSALMAATGGSIEDRRHPEYDGTTPVFKTGGKSNHVQGPGDGQSDDIPAMLADGEFVFDADTVSQLGNGSNKAGAAVLDAMREALRAHKRSAPIGKIPPKSKSPLQYIKDGLKMKGEK